MIEDQRRHIFGTGTFLPPVARALSRWAAGANEGSAGLSGLPQLQGQAAERQASHRRELRRQKKAAGGDGEEGGKEGEAWQKARRRLRPAKKTLSS